MPEHLRKSLRSWIPTAIWLGVIFFLSTDIFSDDHTAKVLSYVVAWLHLPLTPVQVLILNHRIRKLVHISEYAVLSFVSFRSLQQGEKRWRLRWAAGAVLLCMLVAVFDEGFQAFMPDRGGLELRDVILDTSGAALAQLAWWGWGRIRPARSRLVLAGEAD
jgi:VanZ family protein